MTVLPFDEQSGQLGTAFTATTPESAPGPRTPSSTTPGRSRPNMVNEFVAGYNQERDPRTGAELQYQRGPSSPLANSPIGYGALPAVSIYGVSGVAIRPATSQRVSMSTSSPTTSLSVHGRHSWRRRSVHPATRRAGKYVSRHVQLFRLPSRTIPDNGQPGALENVNVSLPSPTFCEETSSRVRTRISTGYRRHRLGVRNLRAGQLVAASRLTINLGLR